MIEDIKGLSVKGRCFSSPTIINFFEKNKQRIALVYGKNGSGKTTISEGFYVCADNSALVHEHTAW